MTMPDELDHALDRLRDAVARRTRANSVPASDVETATEPPGPPIGTEIALTNQHPGGAIGGVSINPTPPQPLPPIGPPPAEEPELPPAGFFSTILRSLGFGRRRSQP